MDFYQFIQEQLKAHDARRSHAVVTIIEADGSTPRSSGKMLVYEDGSSVGTVGGGAVELLAKRDAQECIRKRTNAVKHYNLESEASNTGMTCGGNMSVLIESYSAKPLLVMCGAGHVGGSLIKVARLTGFEVLLIDSRPTELIQDKIDLADHFLPVKHFGQGILEADIAPGAYYVIATFGHSFDGEALEAALQKQGAYVGMIGSRVKVAALFKGLREKGVSDEQLRQVYTPIGLDIGGETPEEISISIMSEILAVKNGRSGRHLSEQGN